MRQILRACQVATLGSVMRLGKKASNLFDQIILRRAQLLALRLLQVLFRHGDVFIRLALISGLIPRRELR